ncbi:hypothetical protein Hypma_003552 [Hypsizygus marmoreus]|uniref:Protein kinase domain-containing protein n=1 Tax=Hypsizygus marmoreus TaxID=39966 RepID=A0A369J8A7_HYPMA|nr:hypothetical protein Hypma_003552 [Hypsizygus marmoreus]
MSVSFVIPDDFDAYSQGSQNSHSNLEAFSQESADPLSEESQRSRSIKQEPFSQEIPPNHAREEIDEARAMVEEFFQYRRPKLKTPATGGATSSKSTRAPAIFDRHLHEDLILHHVVHVPGIVSDLVKIADDALNAHDNLPGINLEGSTPFPTARRLKDAVSNAPTKDIFCEHDVQECYRAITGTHCSVVAATLEAKLSTWSQSFLKWTISDIGKSPKAIPDGFLNIVSVDDDGNYLGLSANLQEVADVTRVIAVWEFKNIETLDLDAWHGLTEEFADCARFPWEGCEHGTLCTFKHLNYVGTTGHPMGFDAENPPCQCIRDARITSGNSRKAGPTPPLPDILQFPQVIRWVLQQAWSEAVHYDTTFLTIHGGNQERIGIRDRENQTLYLSDVIPVDGCNYAKIQTGLYIAALRDAADRSLQMKMKGRPPSWTRLFGLEAITSHLSGKEGEELFDGLVEEALHRDWLIITPLGEQPHIPFYKDSLYKRFAVAAVTKPGPETFFRIHVLTSFGNRISRGVLQVIGTQLQRKKTHKHTIIVKNALGDDAVAILEREHQVYLSLHEAGVQGIPKILGYFQFANTEKKWDPPAYAALVMEDMGRSVHDFEDELGNPFLSPHQLEKFEKILHSIHATGHTHGNLTKQSLMIRGASDSLDVSIIGFGDAHRHPVHDDKGEGTSHGTPTYAPNPHAIKELSHLQRLLNPQRLKRGADGNLAMGSNANETGTELVVPTLMPPQKKPRKF